MKFTAVVTECTDEQGSNLSLWKEAFQKLAPGASVFVHITKGSPTRTSLALRRGGFERRDTILFNDSKRIETILFYRKPLETPNIAKQVLQTKSGMINIDKCIVPGIVPVPTVVRNYRRFDGKYAGKTAHGGEYELVPSPEVKDGRWPPNLTFQHLPGCSKSGVVRYKTIEVDRYTCAPGCHVEALAQQSAAQGVIGSKTIDGIIDDGYAERAFPRFTERKALREWLKDLAETPDGYLLDPFSEVHS